MSKEPTTDPCKINGLNGSSLDPYSRKGKAELAKINCSVINIDEGGSKIFLLGDSISKDLLVWIEKNTGNKNPTSKEIDEYFTNSFGIRMKRSKK